MADARYSSPMDIPACASWLARSSTTPASSCNSRSKEPRNLSQKCGRIRLTVWGTRAMTLEACEYSPLILATQSLSPLRPSSGVPRAARRSSQTKSNWRHWPCGRLVAIWNKLPGVRKIGKFTDRQTGVRRIWNAIEQGSPRLAHTRPQAATKRVAGAKPPVNPNRRSWRAPIRKPPA